MWVGRVSSGCNREQSERLQRQTEQVTEQVPIINLFRIVFHVHYTGWCILYNQIYNITITNI